MKHQIIQSQWEELTEKQQQEWQIKISENHLPYISEMIEFLGDKWWSKISTLIKIDGKLLNKIPINKELCDALFEAVKYKLKN